MRRLAVVLVAFGAVLALATPSKSTVAAVSADCSTATATQLVEQNRLNAFDLPDPVRQVLCGPFMGPGSEAMAVTIGAPTCWPIQHWAIFGFRGGAWQLMAEIPAYLIPPLTAVGNDIREETAVNRAGDPRCLPTGGTHARLWHWDGTKFVAGAPVQVKCADNQVAENIADSVSADDCRISGQAKSRLDCGRLLQHEWDADYVCSRPQEWTERSLQKQHGDLALPKSEYGG